MILIAHTYNLNRSLLKNLKKLHIKKNLLNNLAKYKNQLYKANLMTHIHTINNIHKFKKVYKKVFKKQIITHLKKIV